MSGHETTCIVPIWEGKILENPGIEYNPINGKLISDILKNICTNTLDDLRLFGVKERYCSVPINYDEVAEKINKNKIHIELVHIGFCSGKKYELSTQMIRVAEPIFQPKLENLNCPSIVESTYNVIMKCEEDKRNYFFRNIVLSGGNTAFHGYSKRFKFELQKFHADCEIIAPENRVNDIVNGGATFTYLSSFWDSCISRFEDSKSLFYHIKQLMKKNPNTNNNLE